MARFGVDRSAHPTRLTQDKIPAGFDRSSQAQSGMSFVGFSLFSTSLVSLFWFSFLFRARQGQDCLGLVVLSTTRTARAEGSGTGQITVLSSCLEGQPTSVV